MGAAAFRIMRERNAKLAEAKTEEPVKTESASFDIEHAKSITDKSKLEVYCQEFGYDLDKRKSLKNMLAQLDELVQE